MILTLKVPSTKSVNFSLYFICPSKKKDLHFVGGGADVDYYLSMLAILSINFNIHAVNCLLLQVRSGPLSTLPSEMLNI